MPIYQTAGVCSRHIHFEVSPEGLVSGVRFERGCDGNGQGIAKLAEGRPAEEIIKILSGIRCEGKPTSCPDQLARALREHFEQQATKHVTYACAL